MKLFGGFMKILVVNGHPDLKSFNKVIFDIFVRNIDSRKDEIEILSLAELSFDLVLRQGYRERMPVDAEIMHSQKLVKWAEKIIFIYLIWWSSMPSLLKGWLDHVLTSGFAYRHEKLSMKGLLNANAELWLTSDAPSLFYKMIDHTPINLMKRNILKACGIKVRRVEIFGNTRNATSEQREHWLAKVALPAKNER